METVEIPVDNLKPGSRFAVQVPRTGDLAGRMYLKVGVPEIKGSRLTYNANPILNTKVAWVRRLGHALVKHVEIEVGGSKLDKHVGTWMDVWYELTHSVDQERGYRNMVGDVAELTTLTGLSANDSTEVVLPAHTMYIPLQFWFCRNTGLSLPLIALQYHEVRLYVEFEEISKLVCWSGATAPSMSDVTFEDCGVLVDYFYLDSEERRRFAQVGHEYLIEQVQFGSEQSITTSSGTTNPQKFKLDFNHPSKELVFAMKCGAFNGENLKSSLSGTRGRFLAYTNKDGDAAWETALNYAARNLANGMVVLSTADLSAVTTYGAAYTRIDNSVAIPAGATGVIVQTVAGTRWNFVVTNNGAAAINADEDLPVWVNSTPLSKNSSELGSRLVEVTVTLVVTVVTSNNIVRVDYNGLVVDSTPGVEITAQGLALPYDALSVNEHTLTLRDVSVPVEDFTDSRVHKRVAASSTAKNSWDVTVVQPSNYGLRLDGAGNPVLEGNLTLNGHDRFAVQDGGYFNYLQPAQHHSRTPADGVNVYSFALHPEQHQPSGTANLSRIDSAYLVLKFSDGLRANATIKLDYTTDSKFYIFCFSFNVFRVMSGMGGLAYSN